MQGDGSEGADEDEWGGFGEDDEEEQDSTTVVAQAEHGGSNNKSKPPTGQELRAIQDASLLYRSNSFKLQIDALLPNVRPKGSQKSPLDHFLMTLHTFLRSLPSIPAQHPLLAYKSLGKQGVAVPYTLPFPTRETKWKVTFEKPTDITLVGSWANKISVKGKDDKHFGVDIAVEMPESLFQEKDYLDGRFFFKRSYYLATIAAAIQDEKSALNVEVFYEAALNDPRLTTIVLRPHKDDSQSDFSNLHAQVRIIPVLPSPSPIPFHRLSPSHTNIRTSSDDPAETQLSTPLYNTTLLLSSLPKADLLTNHKLKEISPAFQDAVMLLRVWANQRGYGEGSQLCVRGFEGKGFWWAALLGLLILGEEPSSTGKTNVRQKPLGRGLSSYQLFKAALYFLSRHEFSKSAIFVKSSEGHTFPPEEYVHHHSAVFVDSSSRVNILANVPLGSLELLRHDARKTLEILDHPTSTSDDPFTQVFLREQRHLSTRFDVVLRVELSRAKLSSSVASSSELDHGSSDNALLSSLSTVLHHGLGNRTQAVVLLHPSSEVRLISEVYPSRLTSIYVGLIYDSDHAFRLVDHGPSVEDQDSEEAKQFRNFWGEKAELRRFKDGRITESVVWEVKTSDERAHIPSMVVRHLLGRHFSLVNEDIQTWQAQFDSSLHFPDSVLDLHESSRGSTGFKAAISAFDNIVKGLKALDDQLPLALLNVSPVSEYLRYTSTFSPLPIPASSSLALPEPLRYLPPMDIILEFEKSAKWPDDLRAIQKMKLAFFESIATVIMKAMGGVKATVVVGETSTKTSAIQDQASLEIMTPQGWAFSARIWHDREATLLDRIINDKPRNRKVGQITDVEHNPELHEARQAKELYTRRFIHAPQHHRAINNLCHRFTAFAGTVRLVKRWLASHWLLQCHVSEEAVEIICAHIFLSSDGVGTSVTDASACVPRSKERGFALVVEYLKEWEWENPLFVPLYSTKDSIVSTKPTGAVVSASSRGVWFISTEQDTEGRVWTAGGPDLIVARRIRSLAVATWDFLCGIENSSGFTVKDLFIHPTVHYDIIIELNSSVLPRYFQNVVADPGVWSRKNVSQGSDMGTVVRPGFDPARLFFNDLARTYGETLKFFYDPYGGNRIGAVWIPTLKNPRLFRVLGGFSSIPNKKENEKAKDKGLVVLNERAVLDEIERLGAGLIERIVLQNS
ncbi:hypothetical protein SERLA73DRAFT_92146 [Serpula lacrymans var. lacrymans S7.3]|uniref:U3 small nucleolar RNA-associated protein 22 n=2 Tax=Serpula lacrymans var. lacrymans TaxID=341189 RepID=F8Q1T2_SERL3|nr:uncharacterized protein SERLADRAFT_450501 [Serpula lacrymans var. lacrymans S7.9]EGN97143.1 hypothetical protein SERLA73DRAFT_92146 [Serpula lacrymans var. lacrymans S7.3]EGO22752.1 hypothetical protein SERLADRAFT_450501 [Serpula lacrymans var. lacrymans S7.9]